MMGFLLESEANGLVNTFPDLGTTQQRETNKATNFEGLCVRGQFNAQLVGFAGQWIEDCALIVLIVSVGFEAADDR